MGVLEGHWYTVRVFPLSSNHEVLQALLYLIILNNAIKYVHTKESPMRHVWLLFFCLEMLNTIMLRIIFMQVEFILHKSREAQALCWNTLIWWYCVISKREQPPAYNQNKKEDKWNKGDFISVSHYNCDNIGLVVILIASKRHSS